MDSLSNIAIEPDPFGDLAIPPALEESLQRHRKHIVELILNLRSAGVTEAQIEASVSVVIASYKTELLQTIKRLMSERG